MRIVIIVLLIAAVTLGLGWVFYHRDQRHFQKILSQRVEAGYNRQMVAAIVGSKKTSYLSAGSFPERPEDVIYEIASVTKSFTAHLALILEQEGYFNVHDPIQPHLSPDLILPTYGEDPITFYHLLTHCSGIRDPGPANYYNATNGNTVAIADYTLSDVAAYLKNLSLANAPGRHMAYSNLGYGLLGVAFEQITGESYENLLKSRILTPLNMDSTFLEVPEHKKHLITPGLCNGEEVPLWEIQALPAFGALKSTAKDLALYVCYLFFESRDSPLIQRLFAPFKKLPDFPKITGALGWSLDETYEHLVIAWTGKSLGYFTYIGYCPEKNEAIVLLTDSDDIGSLGDAYFNSDVSLPAPYQETSHPGPTKSFEGTYDGIGACVGMELIITSDGKDLLLSTESERPMRVYPMSNDTYFSKYIDETNTPMKFIRESKKILIELQDAQNTLIAEKRDAKTCP